MMMLPDCPEIAHALATGYPYDYDPPVCARCGCDLFGEACDIDDEYYCKSCAEDVVWSKLEDSSFNDLLELVGGGYVDVSDITF